MALTNGSTIDLELNQAREMAATAFTAADGITFPFDGDCQRMLLVLDNTAGSGTCTFTIPAGNGLMGASEQQVSVAAGKSYGVTLESGGYRQMKGEKKGLLFITASGGTPKAALLKLPQFSL